MDVGLCLKEDKMRCNAEMANFMASVNQTRLQLDVVRLSLSLPLSLLAWVTWQQVLPVDSTI